LTDTFDDALRFDTKYGTGSTGVGYALFLVNQKDLIVNSVQAGLSENPNIYIESDRGADLTINGIVRTSSNTVTEGGIVLVAGGEFNLNNTGKLETSSNSSNPVQVVYRVPDPRFANVQDFFDGGDGVPGKFSTQEVLNAFGTAPSPSLITPIRHYLQQVALNFGYTSPAGAIDAGVNENGFLTFIGYADGKARSFDDQSKPLDTKVFARVTLFNSTFLQENQNLPTNAIVRRADDFFIFENASSVNASGDAGVDNAVADIRDLTFQYEAIDDVISGGISPVDAIPPALVPLQPPIVIGFSLPEVIPDQILFQPPEIELEVSVEKNKEVAIYFIDYDDKNDNGQPDLNEIPSNDKIKEGLEGDVTVPPESIYGPDGGSPTAQDIESKKAALLANPSKPSGVYAIVEKPVDGEPVVLDVFRLLDSETQAASKDEPLLVPDTDEPIILKDIPTPPAPNKDDTSYVPQVMEENEALVRVDEPSRPSSSTSSRFASAGLLFSSLWLVRASAKANKPSAETIAASMEELGSVGFSSRDRRHRRLRSQLGK
jgi:hypothetical protein